MMRTQIYKNAVSSNAFIALGLSIVLGIVGHFISPGFSSFSNILNILVIASFLGVLALAQTIVMITDSGGIDLSVGAILLISMIFIAQIYQTSGGSFVTAVAIALSVCFILGLVNGVFITLLKIPPILMTLAMSSVIIGIILIFTGGFPTGMAPRALSRFIFARTLYLPNMVWVWMFITAFAMFVTRCTKIGRVMYGVGANRLVAELSGVSTRRARALAYGVSGLLCGIAGVFLLGFVSAPNNLAIGERYVMPSIAASVIGGVSLSGGEGTYVGTVTGVIFLTMLEALLMTVQISEPARRIVFGVVIILILINHARKNRKI